MNVLGTAMLMVLLSSNAVVAATIPVGTDPANAMTNNEGINCVIPSDDELVRILSESGDSFLAYIPGDPDVKKEDLKTNSSHPEKSIAEADNFHCPIGETITESSAIRLRSVCPWELLDDFDSNRYPKTIQKAVCRCTHCLDPKTNQPNKKLSCAPVYYPMPVLRRTGCKDGVATFEPKYEEVPVACDCRAKKVRNMDNEVPSMSM